jgi:hypothetical protein
LRLVLSFIQKAYVLGACLLVAFELELKNLYASGD